MRHIKFIILFTVLIVSGCADRVQTYGHILKEQDIAQLKIGISSKNDVLATLGTPSTIATFSKTRWYYLSALVTTKQFDEKKLDSRKVLILDFDESGILSNLIQKGKDDGYHIDPSPKNTRTQGEKLGVVEQIFDNLGQGL